MQDKEILSGVADAFTDKKLGDITIRVAELIEPTQPEYTWWDWMRRKPKPAPVLPELQRTFTIYRPRVGNMYRIAGRAVLLPQEIRSGEIRAVGLELMNAHLKDIVYIVASGIQNNRHEPTTELITFIEDNFDNTDLLGALIMIIDTDEIQSFFSSIDLVRDVTILTPQSNPLDGSE